MRSAELKQVEFVISFDEYKDIVKNPCYYCGVIQCRGLEQFNGIDRDNNMIGYLLDNCVSCCKMCNYMKNTLSGRVFVSRVEHILTFNKHINGNLFPELFADHSCCYSSYKHRAHERQIDFMIAKQEFESLTASSCYLCGKKNSNSHKNGIDRYDNNLGYLIENCRTCCGECNYMKREYTYNDVFDKFKMIYERNTYKKLADEATCNNDDVLKPDIVDSNITSLVVSNKKTQEQLIEERRIRKQKQREALRTRYGDEDYKKMRAKEVATNRAKNKHQNK
jgi:hypothetical protein